MEKRIMKILLYGNCQLYAVMKTLNVDETQNEIKLVECWEEEIKEQEFQESIQKSDLIITQPIADRYRHCNHLSTNYILKEKKPGSQVIIFDSCHFDFYYVDLIYKYHGNEWLNDPSPYHYNEMITYFQNKKSVDDYIANVVKNSSWKTQEELEKIANHSLTELQNRFERNVKLYARENVHVISTGQFIQENYKKQLLFYSMNHPSKYVIQYICEKIIERVGMPNRINYDCDVLSNPKCILYECIQKMVLFDINTCQPWINNETDVKKITEMYFKKYNEIHL
jgi:hypothetical protein